MYDEWSLSAIAEQYDYNDIFKASFAIAPIEQRVTLSSNWNYLGWDIIASTTWVASRDLTDYGYEGYNKNDGTVLKNTTADDYFTVDLKIVKEINEQLNVYIGATNLTDYNQAGDMESPLMFDAEGGYDVVYIHGPLRGRTAYLGFSYEI